METLHIAKGHRLLPYSSRNNLLIEINQGGRSHLDLRLTGRGTKGIGSMVAKELSRCRSEGQDFLRVEQMGVHGNDFKSSLTKKRESRVEDEQLAFG